MAKINLQIRLPEDLEMRLTSLAPKSKSSFVRKAIEEKIQRETDKKLEAAWVKALQAKPEDTKVAEPWVKAESWGPK